MKKLSMILFVTATLLMLPSCNKTEDILQEDNEISIAPTNRLPHYSEVACIIYDGDDPVAAGVRCRSQNGGGCRRETACRAVPSSISAMIEAEFNWDQLAYEPALESYTDIQYALWEWDPVTYWHPDSVIQ